MRLRVTVRGVRLASSNVIVAALAVLCACGSAEREAPAPPPITAAKQDPAAPEPAPAPPAGEGQAGATEASAAAPTAADPPYTPGTSLPGAIPPSPPPVQPAAPADPTQWLRDRETRRADYQKRVAEAEAAAVRADTTVATWERHLLAFKNPFLARPQLAAEDAAAIAGMDGAQRVEWAETKLADARTARDAAKKALEQLKANPPLN